ncbi:MAG: esterase/lipase family protein [Vampirovibrionales bacterium]
MILQLFRSYLSRLHQLQQPDATCTETQGGKHQSPRPWLYGGLGSVCGMLFLRLSPLYKQLAQQEVANLLNYAETVLHPLPWRWLNKLPRLLRLYLAFWYTVLAACCRITSLSKKARQDYYALNRQGGFVQYDVPHVEGEQGTTEARHSHQAPILIVPGLNTPPAFFREMVEHFSNKGYPTYVARLPQQGLGALEEMAQSVNEQLQALHQRYQGQHVHVIGHCLGGLITKYLLDKAPESTPVRSLIALGTGFLGADGVKVLRDYWHQRHPHKPIPAIFDQLIYCNSNNVSHRLVGVMLHSILTIWDFIVPVQKGRLTTEEEIVRATAAPVDTSRLTVAIPEPRTAEAAKASHHVWEDWAIDHLTLALNPKVFAMIEAKLTASVA